MVFTRDAIPDFAAFQKARMNQAFPSFPKYCYMIDLPCLSLVVDLTHVVLSSSTVELIFTVANTLKSKLVLSKFLMRK